MLLLINILISMDNFPSFCIEVIKISKNIFNFKIYSVYYTFLWQSEESRIIDFILEYNVSKT